MPFLSNDLWAADTPQYRDPSLLDMVVLNFPFLASPLKDCFPISENGPQVTAPFETFDESALVQCVHNGELGVPVLCHLLQLG